MKKNFILFLFLISSVMFLQAQDSKKYDEKMLQPAVPFLTIIPDARSAGMGDIGVATAPDISSVFHNTAKLSFIDKKSGFELSYAPWLHKLSSGMSINYLSGYYKINSRQAFTLSLKYFSIGEVQFTHADGSDAGTWQPNEFAVSTGYAMRLTENWSGSVSLKFILSNITGGGASELGKAAAGDLAFFYKKPLEFKTGEGGISFGINFQNIGTKISYNSSISSFIPSNLKTGVNFTYPFNEYNNISFGVELNKLLIPTPPVLDDNGKIIAGTDPNVSVVTGLFKSFYDAPSGFKEEFHEIMWGTGLEYSYNNLVFVRGGAFYEHPLKGGRKYATLGFGFMYNVLKLDFSYLIPIRTHNALDSTMRFSLSFFFNRNKAKKVVE